MPEVYATPTPTGRVVNPYGGTQHRAPGMTASTPSSNTGVDIAAKLGDPMTAPASGTVRRVYATRLDDSKGQRDPNENGGYGGQVVIVDAEGVEHRLSHAMYGSLRVKPGDRVEKGQQVAQVGQSGNTSDGRGGPFPHVDWEAKDPQGRNFDPTTRVAGGSTMTNYTQTHENRGPLPAAPSPAAQSTLDKLKKQESDIRALLKRYEDAAPNTPESFEASSKLPSIYQQLSGVLTQIGAEENRIRDDAKATKGLPAGVTEVNGRLVRVSENPDGSIKTEPLTDSDPAAVAYKQAQTRALGASTALDEARTGAIPSEIAVNQARARDIAAKTGAEVARIVAATGLDEAQANRIGQLLGPEVGRILAETTLTNARTDEIGQTLAPRIAQLMASAGLDEARTAELTGLLSGKLAEQAASLASTEATTGLTQARTGQVSAETEATRLQAEAIRRKQQAWDTYVAPVIARNGTREEILAATRKAATDVNDAVAMLKAEVDLEQLGETRRTNEARERQEQAKIRTGQQTAATEATTNYGRFGLATAPFQSNLLAALAPVTDLSAAAKSIGLNDDNPIVQGVRKAWESFTASQQPAAPTGSAAAASLGVTRPTGPVTAATAAPTVTTTTTPEAAPGVIFGNALANAGAPPLEERRNAFIDALRRA